jgi:anti-anti-sigma regulatory factor
MTGIFTDLGLEVVQYLFWWGDKLEQFHRQRVGRLLRVSRRHPTAMRMLLLLSIAGSFAFGTVAGTIAFAHLAPLSLWVPVSFLLWVVFVDWRTPVADIRELDLLNDPELRLQGIISKLLPPEVVFYRAACPRGRGAHRAPDFQVWLDRVPDRFRVVVLAISPLTRFDANAVMDLEAAVRRLHRDHKKLILSGITNHQFKALNALGVPRMMEINNLCPDLEFAVARAIVLLEDMRPPSTPPTQTVPRVSAPAGV